MSLIASGSSTEGRAVFQKYHVSFSDFETKFIIIRSFLLELPHKSTET